MNPTKYYVVHEPMPGAIYSPEGRVQMFTRQYGSSLSKFIEFFEEAKRTYPLLSHDDCRIEKLGGDCVSGIFALEFNIKEGWGLPPDNDGWIKKDRLEMIR